MADDCKKGEVYSVKHKKCVTSNPDPDKTWGKYMGGGKYFRTKIATEPEKAVVDSMIKEKRVLIWLMIVKKAKFTALNIKSA